MIINQNQSRIRAENDEQENFDLHQNDFDGEDRRRNPGSNPSSGSKTKASVGGPGIYRSGSQNVSSFGENNFINGSANKMKVHMMPAAVGKKSRYLAANNNNLSLGSGTDKGLHRSTNQSSSMSSMF